MRQRDSWFGFGIIGVSIAFLFLYHYPWLDSQTGQTEVRIVADLVVESQAPGRFFIVNQAVTPDGGFIVAHQDLGGRPGSIVGESSYLKPGRNTSMVVVLDQPSVVGQSILVTLYSDNGDYQLTGEDSPLVAENGQTITRQLVIVNQDLLSGQQILVP